ncbi:hypothetical protein ANCCAN_03404 [Ancylostoma caninum]|uniref:Secreted protein n=1 Tax=Ancylostoma caninum TaxID=29170 RepID=A0A368H5G5_ANCCA|nr:hypothetical protein ANCCAN_03404 [Ancylostoma caninum]
MFVLFPLAAAQCLCADACGSACILIYWLLVRVISDGETNDATLRGIKNVARTMKLLWYDASVMLFTLKLNVFLNHSILDDVQRACDHYHWTSAGFEALHCRMKLRITQSTTNQW